MTKQLCLEDSYLATFTAQVTETGATQGEPYIVLNQTAFYPTGGGVPCDTGKIVYDARNIPVLSVKKHGNQIYHYIQGDSPLPPDGTTVSGYIDWERRYQLMKMHTAAHVIAGVITNETSWKITGNQITDEKTRIDFQVDDSFDKEHIPVYFETANALIQEDREIKVYYMPRKEAEEDKQMFKLVHALPPQVENLRIIEIDGYDRQPDGGCHVRRLGEIGGIVYTKFDNRGANNKRIYFELVQ